MLLLPGKAGPDYKIPQGRTHTEPSLFSSEMVLVVILLQPTEPPSLRVASIHKMQRVVHQVITDIPDSETNPEESKYYRIVDPDDLYGEWKQDANFDCQQNRRVHQSLPTYHNHYGSFGSI